MAQVFRRPDSTDVGPTTLFVIDHSPKIVETLKQQFAGGDVCQIVGSSTKATTAIAQLESLRQKQLVDAVLLDLDCQGALDVLPDLRRLVPAIIANSIPDDDDERLNEAKGKGVMYSLERPFSAWELLVALKDVTRKVKRQPPPSEVDPRGRLLACIGAKGGVGVTTITTNLAFNLQRLGLETLLIDGDFQAGNSAELLGLSPSGSTIIDLCDSRTLSRPLLSALQVHPSGLQLLASAPHQEMAELVTPLLWSQILQSAQTVSPLVVVDCSRWLTDLNADLLERANLILVVTDPTATGIVKTKTLLDLLTQRMLLPKEKLLVITNERNPSPVVNHKNLEKLLGRPIDLELPYGGKDLIQAQEGNLPLLGTPAGVKTPWGAALDTFAHNLLPPQGPPVEETPAKRRRFGRRG